MAKAKGSVLVQAVRFLRTQRDRAAGLLDPRLHAYLESERISEASWYPEADLHALIEATLELMPGPRDAALAQMGRGVAQVHAEGAYEHLITDGDVSSFGIRAQALWSTMHDTGRMKARSPEPGVMEVELRDYAMPSEIMCGIVGAYIGEVVRLNGHADVVVEETACRLRGADACAWRYRFRKSS